MDPDDLSEKLRTWRVNPQVPASFRREVWARIAARESARENSFPGRAAEWLSSIFVQPRYALAFGSLSIALGFTYAHQQAQEANARSRSQLEARYAVSVSPFLRQPPHLPPVTEL
jgi:hypothetical protein